MQSTFKELSARKKLIKARAKLVLRDPFFGAIALRLKVRALTSAQVARSRCKTVGTDSVYLVYNPVFVNSIQNIIRLMAVVAHEAAHVAFKHPFRRGNREIGLFNTACDYAINAILTEAGYQLPIGSKFNPRFRGLSSEKIYDILKYERDIKPPEPEPEPEPEPDDDTENQDPDGDDDFGNDDNFGNGDSDDFGDDDDSGNNDDDPGSDDKNNDNDDFTLTDGFNDPDFDGIDDLFVLPEDMENFSEGVVLDAPAAMKTQEGEQKADLEIEQAAIAAKIAGKLPGSLERLIRAHYVHQVNYRDLLRDWMEKNVFPANYTYKKPNRRFPTSEMIMPSMDSEYDIANIGFAVDYSGSVNDKESKIYSSEISSVLSEFESTFIAIYFDTIVRKVIELSSEDLPLDLTVEAGGGTNFIPVFEYIKKERIEINALLFFTDMEPWETWDAIAEHRPFYPVLWMNTNRKMDELTVPFGRIIPLDIKNRK